MEQKTRYMASPFTPLSRQVSTDSPMVTYREFAEGHLPYLRGSWCLYRCEVSLRLDSSPSVTRRSLRCGCTTAGRSQGWRRWHSGRRRHRMMAGLGMSSGLHRSRSSERQSHLLLRPAHNCSCPHTPQLGGGDRQAFTDTGLPMDAPSHTTNHMCRRLVPRSSCYRAHLYENVLDITL